MMKYDGSHVKQCGVPMGSHGLMPQAPIHGPAGPTHLIPKAALQILPGLDVIGTSVVVWVTRRAARLGLLGL